MERLSLHRSGGLGAHLMAPYGVHQAGIRHGPPTLRAFQSTAHTRRYVSQNQILRERHGDGMLQTGAKKEVHNIQGDAHELPIKTGSVDVVIANHMVYLLQDRTRFFVEVRRVLRADGVFFAATNPSSCCIEAWNLAYEAGGP